MRRSAARERSARDSCDKAEHGVEDDDGDDDHRIHELAHDAREDGRGDEHPDDDAFELLGEQSPRTLAPGLRQLVGALFLQASCGFFGCEAGMRICRQRCDSFMRCLCPWRLRCRLVQLRRGLCRSF